jgi:tellurite methyltransferase
MVLHTKNPWHEEYLRRPWEYIWGRVPSALARQVSELLPPRARVVDLGCGEGRDSVFFAARGFQVTGVDASSAGLAKAERFAREQGVWVRWVLGDMAELALEGPYDLIYSLGTIHYVERPARPALFRRLQALSAPAGYHAHVVFTDRTIYPEKGEVIDYFTPGELADLFAGWHLRHAEAGLIPCKQDGRPHQHSIEGIIAQAR